MHTLRVACTTTSTRPRHRYFILCKQPPVASTRAVAADNGDRIKRFLCERTREGQDPNPKQQSDNASAQTQEQEGDQPQLPVMTCLYMHNIVTYMQLKTLA